MATDAELIVRMRAGDAAAFETLFERHAAVLAARARRIVPRSLQRHVSVADVIQEARIGAYRNAAGFRGAGSEVLRAWLLRIVEFKARQAVRRAAGTAKRACGREVTRDGRPATAEIAAPLPSPSEAAMSGELRAAVARTLDSLPPAYGIVLRLTRLEGLTLTEAAARMGRSREATKRLYGRAMVRFTRALGGGEEPRP